MNKQELIDGAIETNKGVSPDEPDAFRLGGIVTCICRQDFEKRAKELGWINGYQWGKEYPTNGNKPDLPESLMIKVRHSDGELMTVPFPVSYWGWPNANQHFIIVDERYKPKTDEQEYEPVIITGGGGASGGGGGGFMPKAEPYITTKNSWHERGELPPVGTECEYNSSGDNWHHVEITAHAKLGLCFIEKGCAGENYTSRDASKFRPIKSERKKFVEVATAVFYNGSLCERMYKALFDAGFRAPK